uniref:Uncharacterized protein n=1 Tax=Tetranychus urticae TaxID=32264 RepID=T1K3H2_TETUR
MVIAKAANAIIMFHDKPSNIQSTRLKSQSSPK